MFNFLKKKKANVYDEEQMKKDQEVFLQNHEYKMKHDPEYRKSVEESAAFFAADREARKAAGLENKIGSYTFTCPNCGSECKGEWVRFDHLGSLHGRTDCFTCDIHLMV